MPTKRKLIMPTDEEDAAIKAGVAADPDTRELTDAELKCLRPMRARPLGSDSKVQLAYDSILT